MMSHVADVEKLKHDAQEGTLLPGSDTQEAKYENQWEAIQWKYQFRPKRRTKSSKVAGLQTAWVVGPPGGRFGLSPYTDRIASSILMTLSACDSV